jgi:hypothetical protein
MKHALTGGSGQAAAAESGPDERRSGGAGESTAVPTAVRGPTTAVERGAERGAHRALRRSGGRSEQHPPGGSSSGSGASSGGGGGTGGGSGGGGGGGHQRLDRRQRRRLDVAAQDEFECNSFLNLVFTS